MIEIRTVLTVRITMLTLANNKIGWFIKPAHADANIKIMKAGEQKTVKRSPVGWVIHLVNRKVSQEDLHVKRTK